MIKYRSSSIEEKIHRLFVRVMSLDLCKKNGFWAICFKNIGVFDSYYIHRYIIMKYW